MIKNNFLEDAQGNKSSKRLWGSILLVIGVLFAITLFIFSVINAAQDPSTALRIIDIFLIAGGSLLGVGVFEKAIRK